jgi:hypothetical protein
MYFWPLVLFLFGLDLVVRVLVRSIAVRSRGDIVLILVGQIHNLEHDIYKVLHICTGIHVCLVVSVAFGLSHRNSN